MSDYFIIKTYRSKKDEVIYMKRFFGMMPVDEIEIEKVYKDSLGMSVTIQAGPNGWTVIWADKGTNYKDEAQGTEKNFAEAFETAAKALGELTEAKTLRLRGETCWSEEDCDECSECSGEECCCDCCDCEECECEE